MLTNRGYCGNAVHIGQSQVHDRDIGEMHLKKVHGIFPRRRFRDQCHVGLAANQRGKTFAQYGVIIDHK
jgi:hypothetical protein